MSLPIKLLSENAILPTRGTINSAGLDLYLPVDVTVPPQSKVSVPLDIAMAIPEGYYGKITIRSGACKREDLMEGAGVIDSDYRWVF
jgi:deoxyuridine 5'-triphosphate nucleotidohydrolase